MKSVVTGGAGFIGSHVVEALSAAGDQVCVIDDLSSGKTDNIAEPISAGARFEQADICEAGAVAAIVGDFKPDRVFHLAAQVDVRKAVSDPGHDAEVNVQGTIKVLEAIREHGPVPLVFTSTGGAIYGEGDGRPIPLDEGADCLPETPYGTSKLAAEEYLALYRRLHGVPSLAMRLGNVYGPRQDPHGEAGVVAIFCGKLINGEPPLVFGDGLQTRDYVYVGDVVAALIGAADLLEEVGTAVEGPYNVGTGHEATVLDLVEVLRPLGSTGFEPEMKPARPGEVQRIALDASAARERLGWVPRVDLAEGLANTFDSVKE